MKTQVYILYFVSLFIPYTLFAQTADFEASALQGCGNFSVEFTSTSVDANSWLWDFGDGVSSTDEHPVHVYSTGGSYDVSLTINGGGCTGCVRTFTNHVKVNSTCFTVEDDFVTSLEGKPQIEVDLLDNDNGISANASVTLLTSPSTGTVSLNSSNQLVYTPVQDFWGTVSIEYEVCDGDFFTDCRTATADIQVTNTDDPVSISAPNTYIKLNEDEKGSFPFVVTNVDGDADPATVSFLSNPTSHGSLAFGDGDEVIYTPDADFFGMDQATLIVSDENGNTDNVVIDFEVAPVDDAPIIIMQQDTISLQQDTYVRFYARLINPDGNSDFATADTIPGLIQNGSLYIQNDSSAFYQPDNGFVGEDFMGLSMCDGNGNCDTAIVCFEVKARQPDNYPPVAVNDTFGFFSTQAGGDFYVLDNDTDPDAGDMVILNNVITDPEHGIALLNTDGSIHFIPDYGYVGDDSLEYTIVDTWGEADTAWLQILIFPGNTAPYANDDNMITYENTSVSMNVLANDSDIDGDNLTVDTVPAQAPSNGTVIIYANGGVNYMPNPGFIGTDSFVYTVCDDGTPVAGCSSATVYIQVDAGGTTKRVINPYNVGNVNNSEASRVSTLESSVYPNPANDIVNIHIGTNDIGNEVEVDIFSPTGQLVWTKRSHEVKGTITLSVNDYPQGVYFVRVVSQAHTKMHRLVIE